MEEDVAWLAMSGYYGELCKQVISGPHIAEWWTIIATRGEYNIKEYTSIAENKTKQAGVAAALVDKSVLLDKKFNVEW